MTQFTCVSEIVTYVNSFSRRTLRCRNVDSAHVARIRAQTRGVRSDLANQMKNIDFRIAGDVILEIRALRGILMPARTGEPVTFDDVSSFDVAVDMADIAVTQESLGALMNSYVLGYEGSPIRNVSPEIKGDRIKQKRKLHKGIGIEFESEGSLSANADGDIVMHADRIKADHVPVKGLPRLFGDELADLVKHVGRGIKLEGDDIITYAGGHDAATRHTWARHAGRD